MCFLSKVSFIGCSQTFAWQWWKHIITAFIWANWWPARLCSWLSILHFWLFNKKKSHKNKYLLILPCLAGLDSSPSSDFRFLCSSRISLLMNRCRGLYTVLADWSSEGLSASCFWIAISQCFFGIMKTITFWLLRVLLAGLFSTSSVISNRGAGCFAKFYSHSQIRWRNTIRIYLLCLCCRCLHAQVRTS